MAGERGRGVEAILYQLRIKGQLEGGRARERDWIQTGYGLDKGAQDGLGRTEMGAGGT